MIRKTITLFTPLVLFALAGCSGGGDSLAGTKGGSETTNGIVMGTVHDSLGSVGSGSAVSLYRYETIPSDSGLLATTSVDSQGNFSFDRLSKGVYSLVSSTADSAERSLSDSIVLASDSSSVQIDDTLTGVGYIAGFYPEPVPAGINAKAVLLRTPFKTALNLDGSFLFSPIPADTYEAAIVFDAGFDHNVVSVESLIVLPGNLTNLDTMHLIELSADSAGYILVDNFDDADVYNELGTRWTTYHDKLRDGQSTAQLAFVPDMSLEMHGYNAQVSYRLDTTLSYPLAGILAFWDSRQPCYKVTVDFSSIDSITFDIRGGPHTISCELGNETVREYFHVWRSSESMDEWTHVAVSLDSAIGAWSSQEQADWQTYSKYISMLQFTIMGVDSSLPDTGAWLIDNVWLHARHND